MDGRPDDLNPVIRTNRNKLINIGILPDFRFFSVSASVGNFLLILIRDACIRYFFRYFDPNDFRTFVIFFLTKESFISIFIFSFFSWNIKLFV